MSRHRHTSAAAFLFAGMSLMLLSCLQNGPSEAELSDFGRYVYALDTLQLEQTTKQLLATDTTSYGSVSTLSSSSSAVRNRYAEAPAEALWFTRLGLSSDADSMLVILRRELPRHGLDSSTFFLPAIADDLHVVRALAFDSLGLNINDVLMRLDYHLSQAFVRYVAGQRYGFTRPNKLLNRHDTKPDGSYVRLFDFDIKAPDYNEVIQALTSETRIDYLQASAPCSPIYQALQMKLDSTSNAQERRTIAVNLERCRWHGAQPESQGRRILVNIPAQHLWAISADSVLDMRICCGATATKTPLLHSEITHIEVNPAWIIPQTIIKAEVSAHAGDTAYFSRHRYTIINRSTGAALNPASVTVAQLQSGNLRVSQQPGAGNSLGRIIFRFPNDFSVFLHDTSTRSAFQRDRRTLSHGCVRVQKPFELAAFILPDADEWTLERLRLSMDLAPTTDRGRTYLDEHADDPRPLRLINRHDVKPHVPVDITYFTAYPNPATGIVELWPDLYGFDALLAPSIPLQ